MLDLKYQLQRLIITNIIITDYVVFYNGKAYDDPKELPLEARQVLEQTAGMLRVFLKY